MIPKKNIKPYCIRCDSETEYVVRELQEEKNVKGCKYFIYAKHAFCSSCGESLFIHELEKNNQIQAYDEYKKDHGLLTSSEIIAIREKYHLSQTKLAKIIRCGEKNIARYEMGAIQDASIDLLIRLVDSNPELFGIECHN